MCVYVAISQHLHQLINHFFCTAMILSERDCMRVFFFHHQDSTKCLPLRNNICLAENSSDKFGLCFGFECEYSYVFSSPFLFVLNQARMEIIVCTNRIYSH